MTHRSISTRRLVRAGCFALALAALSAELPGCSKAPGADQVAAADQLRAQKLIEAGNEAYKIGDYRLAARRYAAAAVVKKDDPAAYFGMGMALTKLGRDEDARAAYQRARELTKQRAALEFKGAPTGAVPGTVPPPPPPPAETTSSGDRASGPKAPTGSGK